MRYLTQVQEFTSIELINHFLRMEKIEYVDLIAYYDVDMYILIYKIEVDGKG